MNKLELESPFYVEMELRFYSPIVAVDDLIYDM